MKKCGEDGKNVDEQRYRNNVDEAIKLLKSNRQAMQWKNPERYNFTIFHHDLEDGRGDLITSVFKVSPILALLYHRCIII